MEIMGGTVGNIRLLRESFFNRTEGMSNWASWKLQKKIRWGAWLWSANAELEKDCQHPHALAYFTSSKKSATAGRCRFTRDVLSSFGAMRQNQFPSLLMSKQDVWYGLNSWSISCSQTGSCLVNAAQFAANHAGMHWADPAHSIDHTHQGLRQSCRWIGEKWLMWRSME